MTRVFVLLFLVLTVAAALIQGAVSVGRRSGWKRLRAQMAAEMEEGSLQALLRARIAGTRVALAESGDAHLAGELAYVDALLAEDYGLRARPEAEQALVRASGARSAAVDVARGLFALGDGNRAQAETLALAAIQAHREDPRPPLLLARARLAAGDLRSASQALEAAMVKGPNATAPVVAWSEARLDLGQPAAALTALTQVVARSADHTRARLLREEAALALKAPPGPDAAALLGACQRDRAVSPVLEAWCALGASVRSRLAGDRGRALAEARRAAGGKQRAPRVLAQTALVLAQLGQVDEAATLVTRATAQVTPALPALVWAQAAVALGRGELPGLPPLAPGHVEVRLLVARAALASGGPAALGKTLRELGGAHADPDLSALSLVLPASPPGPPPEGSPVRAYAEGLRARLAGDTAGAARWLAGALQGHGDACRAAGEYLAVQGLLHQPVTHELDPLRAANTGCLNLALPPASPTKRRTSDDTGQRRRRGLHAP
jgi:tetratricopeptide (TPR) repeat protein